MASLTNITTGYFHELFLFNSQNDSVDEVRDLFLQGSVKQSIPGNPQTTDVLSIPGLIPQLQAKRDISQSYSRTEVDNLITTNPGPTGPQGVAGTNGTNGTNGSNGVNGGPGPMGPTGPTGGGGGSLAASDQTWITEGKLNLNQDNLGAAGGITALRFANDGYIRGRNSGGADELCLYPRTFGNTTILRYGAAGLEIKNNLGQSAIDVNHELSACAPAQIARCS